MIGVNVTISDCRAEDDTHCIDFTDIFPSVSIAPKYSCSPQVVYSVTLYNPLDVVADLVVTVTAGFDDDLRVNGESVGGDCSTPITIDVGTAIASGVAPGEGVTLELIDNFGVYAGGNGQVCWQPWVSP